MVLLPPGFEAATIPENDKYEGIEVDANVLKGYELSSFQSAPTNKIPPLSSSERRHHQMVVHVRRQLLGHQQQG